MKNVFPLLLLLILILSACRENITEPGDDIIEEKPLVLKLKQIEYPSERVIWKQGETHEIKWGITENLENIKIVLLKKFNEVAVITEKTKNDGIFHWAIPNDLPGSHHYRIRIISSDLIAASATSIEFEIETEINEPVDPGK